MTIPGALRHLLAIVLLPVTVAILVPLRLAQREGMTLAPASSALGLAAQAIGVAAGLAGLGLFVASLRRFAVEGQGTLAPWDPPRELVVRGPYRYVRNPMISGVLLLLAGEAVVLRSRAHAVWAFAFFAVNAVYIPLVEEPSLERRFGERYRRYRRHVPRLLPRLRAWDELSPGPRQGRLGG